MEGIGDDLPGCRQDESQCLVRNLIHAIIRNIAYRNPSIARCLEVNIVHSNPIPHNHACFPHPANYSRV